MDNAIREFSWMSEMNKIHTNSYFAIIVWRQANSKLTCKHAKLAMCPRHEDDHVYSGDRLGKECLLSDPDDYTVPER